MLAVVDTNVWVSAFLTPGGTPGRLLETVKNDQLTPVYSRAIEEEYRTVLSRPKFAIDPVLLDEFFLRLAEHGQRVQSGRYPSASLPDRDDAPFIAAALWAGCPIVTGNARHVPTECGAETLSPAECLARLMG
jgi:putative PIN family toxin of toxin-antitoxin system